MEQLANPALYSEQVIELFEQAPAAGIPAGANAAGRAASPSRHAHVALHLRVAAEQVEEAGFEALGCPHLVAGAELVCRDLRGRAVSELSAYSAAFLDRALPLPPEKLDLRIMLEDAVRDAARRAEGD